MKKLTDSIFKYIICNVATKKRALSYLLDDTDHLFLSFKRGGYLKDIGWIKSHASTLPVDGEGQPVPWVTYPFIAFIKGRLHKTLSVFEYGSGNSTLFFAKLVGSVTSVEHDLEWYKKVHKEIPSNVNVIFDSLEYGGSYCKQSTNDKYDIIIVDGRDRVNCCKNAAKSLKPGGVIVLDDSERQQYQEAINFLSDSGYKKIDFWGISPGLFYLKCTSVYYKEENCLNI